MKKMDHYTAEDFQVVQKWKRITFTIDPMIADFLRSRTQYVQCRYGDDIAMLAYNAFTGSQDRSTGATKPPHYLREYVESACGRRLIFRAPRRGKKITVVMQGHQFDDVIEAAKLLDVTAVELMHAALRLRASKLVEFDQSRAVATA